jgi:excisionase family DNA binding protein
MEGDRTELISVFKAARQLGLAPRRLREAIRTGELPAYRPGRRTTYVRWPELLRWLRGQRVPASNHARQRAREIVVEDALKETAAGA